MNQSKSYFKYWGKAGKTEANSYHLLPYHSLDVAAVGHIFLKKNQSILNKFSELTNMKPYQFHQWFTFMLALHDIGKFADSFQNLKQDILKLLQNRESDRTYNLRHDSLGIILWNEHLKAKFQKYNLIDKPQGSWRYQAVETQPIDLWMSVVVGHHGKPPQSVTNRCFSDDFSNEDLNAISEFLEDIIPIFLSNNSAFPSCDIRTTKMVSWWLAGLAVLSDWLGSNTNFFKYKNQKESLDEYYKKVKEQAEKAVSETYILRGQIHSNLQWSSLLKKENNQTITPTPLQSVVSKWCISKSPHLFILEDVTGSGKTEAALFLAHKLMREGQGKGLYFALPTMATSNAMYMRLKKAYKSLFDPKTASLILAHGSRDLVKEFSDSILPESCETENNYGDHTMPAGFHCQSWLADNRKKALLADIGVGTIDQVLLSILPARHQSLRLFGLLNKILLVDEVHACDAYMHKLLCELLEAHAWSGGSTILLSATLSVKQRQDFINCYTKGQNWNTVKLENKKSFPLITYLNKEGLQEQAVDTKKSVKRKLAVKFLSDQGSVHKLLKKAMDQELCVCWIRNTVKDAIDAYNLLKKEFFTDKLNLFHARYALGDRLDIEEKVINSFGKNSYSEVRKNQILIATQVVEQSLDLDFDIVISDLSPIDLLIQRAGRLHRHIRDKKGNPAEGKDQREPACLYVYSPKFTESPDSGWYSQFFPNAKKVYPDHGQLWLTASLLKKHGKLSIPENTRDLIEGVYGEKSQDQIPENLLSHSSKADGEQKAAISVADWNTLKMSLGYTDESSGWRDEGKTPTRLGEENITIYLVKWENGNLNPWWNNEKYKWQLSALSIRSFWIKKEDVENQNIPKEKIEDCKKSLPAEGRWSVVLPLVFNSNNNWEAYAKNQAGRRVCFNYNKTIGLYYYIC